MVPLDLHVLGTPPAFILSQDRTLVMICSFLVTMKLTSTLDISNAFQFPVSCFTAEIMFSIIKEFFEFSMCLTVQLSMF